MARRPRRSRPGGSSPTASTAPAGPGPRLLRCIEDGRLDPVPPGTDLAGLLEIARSGPDRTAVAALLDPHPEDIRELARAWDLHPLLVEDLQEAGQRPKIERHGDVLFLVARAARYLDASERVELSEFHVLLREDAVAVLCQDGRLLDGTPAPDLAGDGEQDGTLERRMPWLDAAPETLRLGPAAIVYRLLDELVDGYGPVIEGLENDRDEIERQVFSGDTAAAARIYRLSREVVDLVQASSGLQRAVQGLRARLERDEAPAELRGRFADVADHLAHAVEDATALRDSLAQILDVNGTLVAQRQNEDMKKISGWAAILFAPTLIAAIYGMNFRHMPELQWTAGYPLSLVAMLVFAVALYVVFRIKKWM